MVQLTQQLYKTKAMRQHGCVAQVCYLSVVSSRQRIIIRLIYVVYSDSPDAGTKVAVIARILETEYERTERGIPKWFNINFEDVDGNESFQTFTLENFEGVQYYSLNSTEEI